jgi:hypothetical protein
LNVTIADLDDAQRTSVEWRNAALQQGFSLSSGLSGSLRGRARLIAIAVLVGALVRRVAFMI